MSDNPFDAIPLSDVQSNEQFFARINETLDTLIDALRVDIDERVKRFGVEDDSLSFRVEYERSKHRLATNPVAHHVFPAVLTAALFRLARAPRANDPLEALFNSPMKDEGTQEK